MGSPVGELSAGVLVPVAERIVAIAVERHAAAVTFSQFWQSPIRNLGGRTEPKVPIKLFGNSHLRNDLGDFEKFSRHVLEYLTAHFP